MTVCRIMTYNVCHGQGMDGQLDLARTAAVISSHGPELLAVQEMDRETTRVGRADQLAELAGRTEMHAAFSKSIDYRGGAYGNAILSRFPILAEHRVALPGAEPRSALACEMELPGGGRWRFVCTHLDLTEEARVESAAALNAFLAGLPTLPTILCGDFNDQPDGPALRALREAGWHEAGGDRLSPTYPADEPTIRIDHVLGRWLPSSAVLSDARPVAERVASDHRPVVATAVLA